jgi:hypothetical protein
MVVIATGAALIGGILVSLRGAQFNAGHAGGGDGFVGRRGSGVVACQFKTDAIRGEGPGGNLSTPINVQKRQMALHAKA